jgi:hypothetical protein
MYNRIVDIMFHDLLKVREDTVEMILYFINQLIHTFTEFVLYYCRNFIKTLAQL